MKGQKCNPKTWKANFRCALNSLPDIEEVKDQSVHKGQQAMRVFRMLPVSQKSKGEKSDRLKGSQLVVLLNALILMSHFNRQTEEIKQIKVKEEGQYHRHFFCTLILHCGMFPFHCVALLYWLRLFCLCRSRLRRRTQTMKSQQSLSLKSHILILHPLRRIQWTAQCPPRSEVSQWVHTITKSPLKHVANV